MVRSTHGVNCTGSCSWKVYVRTASSPGRPRRRTTVDRAGRSEYEPRGCPRGAAFSWYTYSPTRVRYPYVRGVLLEAYRAAKAEHSDPVDAWAAVVGDGRRAPPISVPAARRPGARLMGRGQRIIAAAHVHTIAEHGPDRVFGFSPIRRCRWPRTQQAVGSFHYSAGRC